MAKGAGEMALVLGAFFAAAWGAPLLPRWTDAIQTGLGAGIVFFLTWRLWRDGAAPSTLGIRAGNLASSALAFGVVTGALLAPVLLVGEVLTSLTVSEVLTYFGWASFQQFLVVVGFWRHLRDPREASLRPRRELSAALVAGSVFAVAHAPNPGLIAMVFLAETLWLVLFSAFRNLFVLSMTHALAALVVSHALVPSLWLPSMKVGLSYWRS